MNREEEDESTKSPTHNELVGILKRQTDYTESVILEKLKAHNNNLELVLREFHNIKEPIPAESNMSSNQKIFKSIREFF